MAYARKTAANAAMAVMAMELPTVLAAPLKGVMGELDGLDGLLGVTLNVMISEMLNENITARGSLPSG